MKITRSQIKQIIKEELENYYIDLGVNKGQPTNDIAIIKNSYRKLAMKHHPDRGGDEEKMKAVNVAGQTLLKPEKKKEYDQELFKDTIACKKNLKPGAKFCSGTGVAIGGEALKRFAEIAGIEYSPDDTSGDSASGSPESKPEDSKDFEGQMNNTIEMYKLKRKILDGIFKRAMKYFAEGNLEAGQNFQRLTGEVGDIHDMEGLQKYAAFAKFAD